MFYEFFVSYLTLVINFLEDRGSEEQILRDLTYQFKERSPGGKKDNHGGWQRFVNFTFTMIAKDFAKKTLRHHEKSS